MHDAIVISDIHLGSANSQAKRLVRFLEKIRDGELPTARLILNGDVFDSIDFRRLKKNHWRVLSMLRKLSDQIEIIWICGNHDGSAELVSHLLGVTVRDEYILESGGERILILHGHPFDDFIDAHPILTWVGDLIYGFLLWLDSTHTLARHAKKGSKTFLRCAEKIKQGARELARKRKCTAVCCGHTHHDDADYSDLPYFNSGCWTELPTTYLTITNGVVRLERFDEMVLEDVPALDPAVAVS
ncbi:MAG: UDP-2,3-diacylglucosamine diphosphatase [Gemmataceae bacterium]|nr:UDP-2,3-diacylglucosamine diphosphatase [Gemmataceae bacterium]MDW8264897.1 UDP-2,3-diacylglucosamine diphosphatase [Gemmataceae bacterium]